MKPIFPAPSTHSRNCEGESASVIRTVPSNLPETADTTIFMRMAYSSSPVFSSLSHPGMQRAITIGSCNGA